MATISKGSLTFATIKARLVGQNGVHENPRNSNRQPYGVWYGWNGVPWCAIFMSWGFRGSLGQMGGKAASVPLLRQRFQQQGRYGSTPKVGAFAIFNYDKHVEMVLAVYSTYVLTVGGNTSKADGTNYWGGNVALRKRPRSAIKGYCYPIYATTTTAPSGETTTPPPTTPTTPTLRTLYYNRDKTMTGSDIKRIQSELNRIFPTYSKLVVDGKFGAATDKVVREFQRRAGLVQDGRVGPATRARMAAYGLKLL